MGYTYTISLLIIMALSRPSKADNTKKGHVWLKIAEISNSLEQYKIVIGEYPSEAQGLRVLANLPDGIRPFHKDKSLKDPWGEYFLYRRLPGQKPPFVVYSKGVDRQAGTACDIYPRDFKTIPPQQPCGHLTNPFIYLLIIPLILVVLGIIVYCCQQLLKLPHK